MTANNQLANSNVTPFDTERLKEELTGIKKELNETKEENKVLRSKYEQYKKGAQYAKSKFYEVKSKEGSIANNAAIAVDSKYRLKNTESKNEIKRITEEKYKLAEDCSQLKVKLLQALQLNKASREENDKVNKQMKRLFERLD